MSNQAFQEEHFPIPYLIASISPDFTDKETDAESDLLKVLTQVRN